MNPDHKALKAARSFLSLEQRDVERVTGIPRTRLSQFERGQAGLSTENLNKLTTFYTGMGLRFTESGGVEPIPDNTVRHLSGRAGFRSLMNEVYRYAQEHGGDIEILNGAPDLFLHWLGEDWYAMHADRMCQIRDKIRFRILTHEGQENLIAKNFAEYRRIPEAQFNTQSVYLFGNQAAIFDFQKETVNIHVFTGAGLVQTLRQAFEFFWENAR